MDPKIYTLTIHGIPRTKKTSNQTFLTVHTAAVKGWLAECMRSTKPTRAVLSRVKVNPSKKYQEWERTAVIEWTSEPPESTIMELVGVRALIYREAATGDHCGFTQAIGDYLQQTKLMHAPGPILHNDSLIAHWDGTRRLKDSKNPRIELTITIEGPSNASRKDDKLRAKRKAQSGQGSLPLNRPDGRSTSVEINLQE